MSLLAPSPALLCKLASIAVHADEYLSPDGHDLDRAALISALGDVDVKAWLADMTDAAMAPRKRNPRS